MNPFDAVKYICRNHKTIRVLQWKSCLAMYALAVSPTLGSHAGNPPPPKVPAPYVNYVAPTVNNNMAGSTPMMIAPAPKFNPQPIPSLGQTPFYPAQTTPYVSTPSVYLAPTVNNNMAGSTPMLIAPAPKLAAQPLQSFVQTPFCPAQTTPYVSNPLVITVQPQIKSAPVSLLPPPCYQIPIQQPPAYQISASPTLIQTSQSTPAYSSSAVPSYTRLSAPSVPRAFSTQTNYYMAHATPARISVQQPPRAPIFSIEKGLDLDAVVQRLFHPRSQTQPVAQPVAPKSPYDGMLTIYPLSPPPVGRTIGSGQCTDYATARFAQAAGQDKGFKANANDWLNQAQQTWRTLPPNAPIVPPGSVAVYDDSLTVNGKRIFTGEGHVAIVEASMDGKILFSEQNWKPNKVSTTTMSVSQYITRGTKGGWNAVKPDANISQEEIDAAKATGLPHTYQLTGFIVPVKLDQNQ